MDILLQIPAHILLSTIHGSYKKAYLLKGGGNSGKTTYINLLNSHFFGVDNCSNIKLQELINDRFKPAGLVGKIANIADELSKIKLGDIGKFKEITGGGRITVERKFEHPYSYQNKAVLIFATNEYPPVDDVDDAFWQRWEILEFKKSFPIDPSFESRIFTHKNLSAFLNLVIDRLKAIIKAGGLKQGRNLEETKRMWLYDSDSVYRFKHTCLIRDIHTTIVKQDLYSRYLIYCEEKENPPVSQKDFSIKMQRFGAVDVQIDKGEGRVRCFRGFGFRSD
jgi:putative DNA primase/helicase